MESIDKAIAEEIKNRVDVIEDCIGRIKAEIDEVIRQVTQKCGEKVGDLMAEAEKYRDMLKMPEIDERVLRNLKQFSLKSNFKGLSADLGFIDSFLNQEFIEEEGKGLDIDVEYKDVNQIKSLLADKAEIIIEGHLSEVNAMVKYENILISAGKDKVIRYWDIKTYQQKSHFYCKSVINSISSVHNLVFATGSEDRSVKIWDFTGKSLISTFSGHSAPVTSVILTKSSEKVISSSTDNLIKVWDLVNKIELFSLPGHTFAVWTLALSSNERFLYSGAGGKELSKKDYSIRVWDLLKSQPIDQLQGHEDFVLCLSLASDDSVLYSGSRDSHIYIWNCHTNLLISKIKAHSSWVTALSLSNNDKFLFSGSADNTIRVWNTTDYSLKDTFSAHIHQIKSIIYNSLDNSIFSCSCDRSIKSWDLASKNSSIFQGHSDIVNCISFTSDKKWAVSGSKDKTIRIWNLRKNKQEKVLEGHTGEVQGIVFCKDNNTFLSVGDRTVRVWKLCGVREEEILTGHGSNLYCLAVSDNDFYAASGGGDLFNRDYSVRLWNLNENKQEFVYKGHSDSVYALKFTQDSEILVSGGFDKNIRVWGVRDKECKMIFEGHKSTIFKVLLTKDCNNIVSGSRDGEFRIWNIHEKKCEDCFSGAENAEKWVKAFPEASYFFNN